MGKLICYKIDLTNMNLEQDSYLMLTINTTTNIIVLRVLTYLSYCLQLKYNSQLSMSKVWNSENSM